MRVLQKKKPWWTGRIIKCRNCNAKLVLSANDRVKEDSDTCDQVCYHGVHAEVRCPECKIDTWFFEICWHKEYKKPKRKCPEC